MTTNDEQYDPRMDQETVERLQNAFDPTAEKDEVFSRPDALGRLAREHARRERYDEDGPIFPFELSDGTWVVEGEADTISHGRGTCRKYISSVTYVGKIADEDDLDVDDDAEVCPDCGYDRCETNHFSNGVVGGHVVSCKLCNRALREVAP